MVARRRERGRTTAQPVVVDDAARIEHAIEGAIGRRLGREVELTGDQRTAIGEAGRDIGARVPMLRLIQGDVGSGKTAVAAWALAGVALAGRQGALLAPTDLLARQHATTVGELVRPATPDDEASARRCEGRGREVCARGRELAASLGLFSSCCGAIPRPSPAGDDGT